MIQVFLELRYSVSIYWAVKLKLRMGLGTIRAHGVYPIPIPTVHDRWTFWGGGGDWGIIVGVGGAGVVTTRGCLCILTHSRVILMLC